MLPVLEGLADAGARLSIDTSKAAVAAAAIDAGATIVNDVTALRGDERMAALVAERGCDVCLMHMLGEPRTMQRDPRYDDVVDDVRAFLAARLEHAVARGIDEERVWLDPGIGFGKTIDHNLALLRASTRSSRSAGRSSSGPRASRFSARSPAATAGDRVAGDDRDERARAGARRERLSRPRRRRGARCPRGRGCYVARSMGTGDEDDIDESLDDDEFDDDEDRVQTVVTVEVNGLSLYTHHGVTAAEREVGQRLILDIRLELGEADATVTDRVEDTVDYGRVCEVAALVATQRSDKTLERLCAAIADRLLKDFDAQAVSVKASKPEPPIPLPVEDVSVEVWRELGELDD